MSAIKSHRLTESSWFLPVIAGIAMIAATVFAYWPGLHGPFVLDDFGSVAALGKQGGVVDWESFKAFVFGGHAGPTGRPLSLLSFLIDANNWPAESWPFKRTNLIIHCFTGIVLGLLTQEILSVLKYRRRDAVVLSLVTAGIWLLHPFLVSTTLYVVQRMAQLSTMFALLGMLFYLRARRNLLVRPMRAYLMMTLSIGVFGVLSILSKENGILLPLLIAVAEFTVVASQRQQLGRLNRYWSIAFFVIPALVITAYLGERVFRENFFDVVPPREFSIYERLLTQPRILFDYLQHWFIPKLYTTGVFQDHFLKSTGLLSPVTTLVALLGHVALISAACIQRRRWPLFAFAVLFFYVGHLLESTVINLELYFEHRNYLAAAFLFLPLLAVVQQKISLQKFALASVFVLVLLGGFTRYSSTIWASLPAMVEASAQKAPTSARAQAQYSVMLFNAGRQEKSLEVLDRAIERIPAANPLLRVNKLITLCYMDQLPVSDFDDAVIVLSDVPYDARSITVYTRFAEAVVEGKCPTISPATLNRLFTGMLQLEYNTRPGTLEYAQIQYLKGYTHAYAGDPELAITAFNESLSARNGASHAMQMAAVLASNDYLREALEFSDRAIQQLQEESLSISRAAPVRESDIREFQRIVRADMASQSGTDSSDP